MELGVSGDAEAVLLGPARPRVGAEGGGTPVHAALTSDFKKYIPVQ